jgi:hypothetical protein
VKYAFYYSRIHNADAQALPVTSPRRARLPADGTAPRRPVPGWEGFYEHDGQHVYSVERTIARPQKRVIRARRLHVVEAGGRYPAVQLSRDGKRRTFYLRDITRR